MSFLSSNAYSIAMKDSRPAIALVTGGKSGIGQALARKLASFPFIDSVMAVSRSISATDVDHPKIQPLAADVTTPEGRQTILDAVNESCCDSDGARTKQLRFLIHSAGTIGNIKPAWEVTPEELRFALMVNCEAPFFLSTSLFDYMTPLDGDGVAGRVLHVSSGAAHGAPPVGWSVYGISKAAFFQSFKILEREFRETGEGKVVVGSFKPGVVDTSMQGTIRDAPPSSMPIVKAFQNMKAKTESNAPVIKARPPPSGALDSPDNVALFAEYLLMGTTDEEFGNKDDPKEYDIRNAELYPLWIPEENLPKKEN